VALNNPSVEKYEPLLAPDGNLIYNSSLAVKAVTRRDICVIPIPASEVAAELGSGKLLNMVMLGALIERTQVLPLEAVERALEAHLSAPHQALLNLNWQALRRGAELACDVLALA
jgi:2-oxoglutarate ferredoxin oxidoreductase subunit gamma